MPKDAVLRVTLDACVIYPVLICDALLTPAELGIFLPLWSSKILQEVLNTSRKIAALDRYFSIASRLASMNEAFPEAVCDAPEKLEKKWQELLPDKQDAHVVATALHSQSTVIVTENLKDFPRKVLSPYGLEAMSFDSFMCKLLVYSPEATLLAVRKMAESKSNPPLSIAELLAQLEQRAPNFTGRSKNLGS